MANATLTELRTKTDAAFTQLTRQLDGMEPHLERSDAPGEWTAREVLAHLLFEPGSNPVTVLKTFHETDLPLFDLKPGEVHMMPERQAMTLRQYHDALDGQRRDVFAYLGALPEGDLGRRKARIPLFKQIIGTEEVPLAVFVGGLFDYHWNDHAGQLAKIRNAVGLSEA